TVFLPHGLGLQRGGLPVVVYLWLKRIFSFRGLLDRLEPDVGGQTVPLQELTQGAPAFDSLAVVCSGDLRRRLVPVHTGLYWRAASSPKSIGSALAVASADFVLCFRFHCGHTFLFLVELASQWGIFPFFFRDARADS